MNAIIDQFLDDHYYIYTGDSQLYSFLFHSSNELPDNSQLCKCSSTIISWLNSNNLLLNSTKSEFLNSPSNYHVSLLFSVPLGHPINPSSSVLNLGVTLDADLSLNSHIYNIYISKLSPFKNSYPIRTFWY